MMWGAAASERDGIVTVLAANDNSPAEYLDIYATKQGNGFESLEPIRECVRAAYGTYATRGASGLIVQHDNGSQYVSRQF